jgi:hypothetical protein
MVRLAGLIRQPRQAGMAITLKPLVAGLATDAERATDFG